MTNQNQGAKLGKSFFEGGIMQLAQILPDNQTVTEMNDLMF